MRVAEDVQREQERCRGWEGERSVMTVVSAGQGLICNERGMGKDSCSSPDVRNQEESVQLAAAP
jgi:hypothetical protein